METAGVLARQVGPTEAEFSNCERCVQKFLLAAESHVNLTAGFRSAYKRMKNKQKQAVEKFLAGFSWNWLSRYRWAADRRICQ
jgi:hypothetical protein